MVLRRRLGGLDLLPGSTVKAATQPETATNEMLCKAWSGLAQECWSDEPYALVAQLQAVGKLLSGKDFPLPVIWPMWVSLLAGPGALALRAASPLTDEADRAALRVLLATLADSGLADAGPEVQIILKGDFAGLPDAPVTVTRSGELLNLLISGRSPIIRRDGTCAVMGLQRAPKSDFSAPPGTTVRESFVCGGGWSGRDRFTAFTGQLTANGPAKWRPECVDRLVQATGMPRAEAALLLAGLPGIDSRYANFLTAGQRSLLGVNVKQAQVARDSLRRLSGSDRVALLDAAMPRDPVALWEHGPDVEALAARWIGLRGGQVAVPESLLGEAAKVLPKPHLATETIQFLAAPAPGSWITTDGKTIPDCLSLKTTVPGGSGTPFDQTWAYSAAIALAWLAYRLPWGDPIRAALPAALDLIQQRLRNPDLLIGTGNVWRHNLPQRAPALRIEGGDMAYVYVRPSKLDGPADRALEFIDTHSRFVLWLLLHPHLANVVATPERAQGCPHDPAVSVPDVVKTAAEKLGLTTEAAAYYLQLLALPDPTDRNVLAWNGWKPGRLRAIQKALLDAGLVIAATRQRAGRPVFLPGGWQPFQNPTLPLESWKISLYVNRPASRILVLETVPDLFRKVWERIEAGETPQDITGGGPPA
jgi:hypothetical protein